MTAAFAWTALLMGLAGGPHCLAMCATPCSAVAGGGRPGRQALFHGGRLLGYALGRSTTLSDTVLLERMEAAMQARGGRVSAALETIVLSPQFRQVRGNGESR